MAQEIRKRDSEGAIALRAAILQEFTVLLAEAFFSSLA